MICFSIKAQTNVVQKVPEVDSIFSAKLTGEFFYENKNYIGEQFFNKDWDEGNILLSTGEMIYGKYLKYNGLLDELIWLNTSNFGQFKLDKSYINEFWFKNLPESDLHFKRINVDDTSSIHIRDIFVQVKAEGKISLYIQRKISIIESVDVTKNNADYRYQKLETKPGYYIKLPSNQYFVLTKVRRIAFIRLFPEKKKSINKIIRENHLNIRKEDDFTKLIELMNEKAMF